MIRSSALAALTVLVAAASVAPSAASAEGYCKSGDNYDEAKGLCYAPAAAYKPDVPMGAAAPGSTGSWLPSLGGITSSIAGKAAFCNYGDRLVGSGDQAYCVSKATNKPYPAGR
ncbi:MAG TPA: hypothetical protein VFS04_04010 [Alphaproteobacteria bacterium]|nr:hypothetical protein [Alphaproteobacteria bacterium]